MYASDGAAPEPPNNISITWWQWQEPPYANVIISTYICTIRVCIFLATLGVLLLPFHYLETLLNHCHSISDSDDSNSLLKMSAFFYG